MKRVLITGGSSGIGLAAVKLFLERGWQVMIAAQDAKKGEAVVADFESQGLHNVFFCACDIASSQDVAKLYEQVKAKMGGLDSVVNNAAIFTTGAVHELTEDQWDRMFDVNVKSIYLMTKYFIPDMITQGGGTVVNTSSVCGMLGGYNMASYSAAKGAVVNLCRAMAMDYGKFNIRVNNVCPSACATPMFLKNPPETVKLFEENNPLGRICTPEEVARAIYFLASDESSSCNGVNLPITGGLDAFTGEPIQK